MEAGCKKKIRLKTKDGKHRYAWKSSGQLLALRVCILKDYQKFLPPKEDGSTEVYTTIESQKVRDVDAKKKTLSIDFGLTMSTEIEFIYCV